MADVQWAQVIPSLLGGGAAGAVLKHFFDLWLRRPQPVRCFIDVDRVFNAEKTAPIVGSVSISHGTDEYQLANLSVARVVVTNRGNLDRDSIDLGVTISGPYEAVFAEGASDDHHHKADVLTDVRPNSVIKTVDFRFRPFNRGDRYTAKLFVHSPAGASLEPGHISLSTPAPVRLIRSTRVDEQVATALVTNTRMIAVWWVAALAATIAFTATILDVFIGWSHFGR